MRAHITTRSLPSCRARHVVVPLMLGIFALAVPAGAIAQPQPGSAGNDSADTVIRRDGSAAVPFVRYVNGAPPAAAEARFDWGSAAVGAGAAMALVALGGAGFLTVRTRVFRAYTGLSEPRR